MERGFGREAEIGVLDAAFARARAGQGSAVIVAGEAGVGKTHLVETFLDSCGEDSVVVELGPAERGLPSLTPLARAGDALAARSRDPLTAAAIADMSSAVRTGRKPREIRRLFDELVELLQTRGPVVVTLDVTASTPRSLVEAVAHVARRSGARRVMSVFLTRPGDRRLDAVLIRTDALVLPVDPFDPVTAEKFVREVAGPGLDEDTVGRILERARGNPLTLKDLCTAARRTAGIDPDEPSLLAARRIARLSPAARATLQVAAVCTEPVTGRFSALVTGHDPADTVPVRELVDAGLVAVGADSTLVLTPLVAEIALSEAPAGEIRSIRRRVVRLLMLLGADPAEIANHALPSATPGDPFSPKAIELATGAAESLMRAGSPEAALEMAARAQALGPTGTIEARLTTIEAEALLHLGRTADATHTFERAITLGAGEQATLGLARALQRRGLLAAALEMFGRCHGTGASHGRAEVLLGLGRTAEAAEAAAATVEEARARGDRTALATALADHALAQAVRNRPDAVGLGLEAVSLWRRLGEDSLDWPPLFGLGVAYEAADRFAESLAVLGELRSWLDRRGLVDLVPRTVRTETIAAFLSCEWAHMEEATASAIDVKRGLPNHEMAPIWASVATLAAARGDDYLWERALLRSEDALVEQATAFDRALSAWWRMIGHTFRLEFGPAREAGDIAVAGFRRIGALDFLARTLPSSALLAGLQGDPDPGLALEYGQLTEGVTKPSIRAGTHMIEAATAPDARTLAGRLVEAATVYREGEHRLGMLMSVLGAVLAEPSEVPSDLRAECERISSSLSLNNALVGSLRSAS